VRAAAQALLVVLVLSACDATGSGSGSPPASQAQRRSSARLGGAPVALASDLGGFAIFRRAPTAGDLIPPSEAVGGVKPKLSRLAYSGPLGMFYAYAHAGLLCVSYETRISLSRGAGIGRCDSVAAANANGVALPVPATLDHIDRLALLLPDGVGTVVIARASGGAITVPVRQNAAVYAWRGIRTWSFTTPDGAKVTASLRPAAPASPARHGP
jgi:hypothetical protein